MCCSLDTSRQIAARMLDCDVATVNASDGLDALAELANIVGGNFKPMLPPPSWLDAPKVADSMPAEPTAINAERLAHVQLQVNAEDVALSLFRTAAEPATPVAATPPSQ